jgi:hypothetical protein
MGTSRVVHVVRCKNPKNSQMYVDVKVIDAIGYQTVNGDTGMFYCPAKSAVPLIVDNTGDGNGVTSGNPSRASHMVRLTGSTDPSMVIDVEVLDAIAFQSVNGMQFMLTMAPGGEFIVDNTDGNLANAVDDASRGLHVVKLAAPAASGATSPTALYVKRLDAVAFESVSGEQNLIFQPGDGPNEIDATIYNSDGSPPDNADPNIYVAWPQKVNGGQGTSGPYLGKNIGTDQGLLWWIVGATGVTNKYGPGGTTSTVYYLWLWPIYYTEVITETLLDGEVTGLSSQLVSGAYSGPTGITSSVKIQIGVVPNLPGLPGGPIYATQQTSVATVIISGSGVEPTFNAKTVYLVAELEFVNSVPPPSPQVLDSVIVAKIVQSLSTNQQLNPVPTDYGDAGRAASLAAEIGAAVAIYGWNCAFNVASVT